MTDHARKLLDVVAGGGRTVRSDAGDASGLTEGMYRAALQELCEVGAIVWGVRLGACRVRASGAGRRD